MARLGQKRQVGEGIALLFLACSSKVFHKPEGRQVTGSLVAQAVLAPRSKRPLFPSKPLIWDFPGGPVAKTLRSQCRGPGFDPWSGN